MYERPLHTQLLPAARCPTDGHALPPARLWRVTLRSRTCEPAAPAGRERHVCVHSLQNDHALTLQSAFLHGCVLQFLASSSSGQALP